MKPKNNSSKLDVNFLQRMQLNATNNPALHIAGQTDEDIMAVQLIRKDFPNIDLKHCQLSPTQVLQHLQNKTVIGYKTPEQQALDRDIAALSRENTKKRITQFRLKEISKFAKNNPKAAQSFLKELKNRKVRTMQNNHLKFTKLFAEMKKAYPDFNMRPKFKENIDQRTISGVFNECLGHVQRNEYGIAYRKLQQIYKVF